ncbi:CheR family methyltransferase [Sphingomonas japonica]|uniref:Chemotaxis protein methyltransferase CheR n=1 Tax=Sphingomonas japonica TaxID=511662 RepID=A0ABX0U2D7_9SPHN|nr:protein-glutamate O-methyltransferase CheR [Sphingomonas japonica]NIJ24734.1 chemotaxis protein methyltransferase CheR [Sphingomonas japonica]
MTAPAIPASRSTAATNLIAALLEARTGQQIGANRVWRIESALKPLMRQQGIDTIDLLAAALTTRSGGSLADRVVEALLNQETSFFRDAGVLEQAIEAVLKRLDAAPFVRPRIWSVGCSTGQEALSLAMLLDERTPAAAPRVEIIASDVSQRALDRARAGRYSQFEIQRGLPVRRMLQWFDAVGEEWTAKPGLVSRIQYRRHNLVTEPPPGGRFDLILCRNVLFYFSPAVRRGVFEQLAGALRPGGLLVLGAGETVIGQTERLAPSPHWRGFYSSCPDTALPRARAI